MKIRIICTLFLFACISCEKDGKLTFEATTFDQENCDDCPLVTITVPKALGTSKIVRTVNDVVTEEIISLLNFDEDNDAETINSAMESFRKEYQTLKEKFPEESMQWEAEIQGDVVFEDARILTIRLKSYLFTGGAHGYSTIRFSNFDKRKGIELENSKLFKNKGAFMDLAEAKFRSQEKIPATQSINSTGFMFDGETFYLPENIGFTPEGIQLLYNQYEVASYADGPIILTLPYDEVKDYLTVKIKT
ncbi:DUF3298 and DUF4163 domain-containing protein [Maribacter aestuarii]|uniref:DUF3298 and DUF4163 domain-containing protein n=1 Tax=Maribacter aestuarii TaxID=1130723 RepID=UPI00248C82BA|nr:DUF3298 and DUF4163 domain-containing protein [Maribacter aestuarii]